MVDLPLRRVTCPKCGGSFDYEFVPMASMTAIRLGRSRYMRCPLCHRYALIRLYGTGSEPVPPSP